MPSGKEITLSCTLGDSHNRERAVLCADTACHFFSRYVTWTRGDRFVRCRTVLTSIALCMVLFRRMSPERADELDS
jgi:hypothetical protein